MTRGGGETRLGGLFRRNDQGDEGLVGVRCGSVCLSPAQPSAAAHATPAAEQLSRPPFPGGRLQSPSFPVARMARRKRTMSTARQKRDETGDGTAVNRSAVAHVASQTLKIRAAGSREQPPMNSGTASSLMHASLQPSVALGVRA